MVASVNLSEYIQSKGVPTEGHGVTFTHYDTGTPVPCSFVKIDEEKGKCIIKRDDGGNPNWKVDVSSVTVNVSI